MRATGSSPTSPATRSAPASRSAPSPTTTSSCSTRPATTPATASPSRARRRPAGSTSSTATPPTATAATASSPRASGIHLIDNSAQVNGGWGIYARRRHRRRQQLRGRQHGAGAVLRRHLRHRRGPRRAGDLDRAGPARRRPGHARHPEQQPQRQLHLHGLRRGQPDPRARLRVPDRHAPTRSPGRTASTRPRSSTSAPASTSSRSAPSTCWAPGCPTPRRPGSSGPTCRCRPTTRRRSSSTSCRPAETWLPDVLFTFHSNEPDVTFECKVDLWGWEPCGFEGAAYM